MVTVVHRRLDSSSEDDRIRIMPETAHEVSAIVLLTIDGRKVPFGNIRIRDDFDNLPNVMVRLGTKVSEGHPSSIGFRVLLRTEVPRSNDSRSIEDNYHLVSCKFDPEGGEVSHMLATKEDKRELTETLPFRKSLGEDLSVSINEDLYRMEFTLSDTNGFLISHHKPDLRTSNGQVKKIEKLLPFIAYATKISVFYIADKLLLKHLENAIKQHCVGAVLPSWKTALPDSAVSKWPSNVQTQMVAGSVDIYNNLLIALHENPLQDGSGTLINERPEAMQFKSYVCETYPGVRQEASSKVYPVFLNVSGSGPCTELPFGASMLNRGNTYATINALHKLLAAGIALDHVGIITLYPTQVEAYHDALHRCLKLAPRSGYDHVQVGLLEDWVGKRISIVIVDLVRTSNASGNLGYLSQANRLKVLLTLHRNGLIVVGNRRCTVNSHGNVTSTKLDKVLQWFVDNGRIVEMDDKGLPRSSQQVPSATDPQYSKTRQPLPEPSQASATDATPSSTSSEASRGKASSVSSAGTLKTTRKYVGIPGLEYVKIKEPVNENDSLSLSRNLKFTDLDATRASFARQGFKNLNRAYSRPEPITSVAGSVHNSHWQKNIPKTEIIETEGKPKANGSLDIQASSGKGFNAKGGKKDQQAHNLTLEASASKVNVTELPVIEDVASKATNPFGPPSATSKAKELSTPQAEESPSTDIRARFEEVTNRFKMEFGSDVYDTILDERRSKLSNLAESNISAKKPAALADPGSAIPKREVSSANAMQENDKPATAGKNIPSKSFYIQPKTTSPPRGFTLKTPLLNKTTNHLADRPLQVPSGKRSNIGEASPVRQPRSLSPKKVSNNVTTNDENKKPLRNGPTSIAAKSEIGQEAGKPHRKGPSFPAAEIKIGQAAEKPHQNNSISPAAEANTGQEAQQNPDFKTDHQKKYRAIRSLFANMSDMPRDTTGEDQLFRRLAEALMDEDAGAFERTYTELLGMAAKLQTRVLRRA